MPEETKFCHQCATEKPKSEFNKSPRAKCGVRSSCRKCDNAKAREWKAANRDKVIAGIVSYGKRNPDKRAAAKKAWYNANREKSAEQNRLWCLANPERKAQSDRNRRAAKKSAGGSHTIAEVMVIFEGQRGLCATCEKKLFKSGVKKFHIDHIQPLAKGGSDSKDNLQCLCPGCNRKKGSKDPLEWARENGKLI